MRKKLILFDLDGTLLWTDGAGRAAIHQALIDETGTQGPFEEISFAGKTDTAITRELLRSINHPDADNDEHIMRICNRYAALLEGELQAPERNVRAYVGVHELLERLRVRKDAVLGLLTGNVERGAILKLEAVGIDPEQFRVAAYGSDAFERDALPPIAVSRAAAVLGHVPRGKEVVIIGDTPADMTCGKGIGARPIGVATGPFDLADLEASGAFAVFEDLSMPDMVMTAIFA